MTPQSQSLVFAPSPLSLSVSIAFLVLIAALGFVTWHRSHYRTTIGALEALRLCIATGIAFTLNQPEWRQIFRPENKPTLAVLVDHSRSMETRDIVVAKNDAKSRAETAVPLAEPTAWQSLAQRMDIAIEPFSSTQKTPEEGTDLNTALNAVAQKYQRLAGVVLLTDGDWNTGDPPAQAATRLRMREVPVFAVAIGAETRLPDVAVSSFEVPTFAVAGKPLRIPFTIESSLPREEPATLEMKTSNGEALTKQVVIPAMGRLQDVFTWKPDKPGDVTLTLTVPKTGAERLLENNTVEARLSIRKEQLHILVIDSYPRWEYRYLRNALQRDPGVAVKTLLFQPDLGAPGAGRDYLQSFPKPEELTAFDVVFLGDVGVEKGQLTSEQCDAIQKLIRDQAAGLVFLPGNRGYESTLQNTALNDLLPVVLDETQPRGWGTSTTGKFVLTEAGARSLLTKLEDTDEASARTWQNLPGFQWYAPAVRAKVGTEILATHGSESSRFGRVPLIVTKTYGAGKILFMGTDNAWRWRRGVEDRYHYRFWGQVVRWMAYQRNMTQGDKMRLFYSPDRPQSGAVLTLNANVAGPTGEPLREGTVIAQITAPSGHTSSVRLLPAGQDAWGLFTGNFTPDEPGEHKVRVSSAEAGQALETSISIQGTSRERIGQPVRLEVLREIAQLTRGKLFTTADPKEITAAIAALPTATDLEHRIQIWAHPIWAGFLTLLLAIFWAGRKAAGAF